MSLKTFSAVLMQMYQNERLRQTILNIIYYLLPTLSWIIDRRKQEHFIWNR